MKKSILTLLSITLIFTLPQLVLAGEKGGGAFGGKVTAVGEGTITISNKKAGDKTFKTGAGTKYAKSDKTDAAAADVKVGSKVRVKAGTDSDQAAQVTLVVRVNKESGGEGKTGEGREGDDVSGKKDSKDAPEAMTESTPSAAPKATPRDATKESGEPHEGAEKPAN